MSNLTLKSASHRSVFSLAGALSAACLYAALLGSLQATFGLFETRLPWWIGFGILGASWLTRKCKSATWIRLGVVACGCIVGFCFFDLLDGLLGLFNVVSEALGARLGRIFSQYAVSGKGVESACVFLGAGLALGCERLIRTRNSFVFTLVALGGAVLNLGMDAAAASPWIALFALSWLLTRLPDGLWSEDSPAGLRTFLGFALVAGAILCAAVFFLNRFEIPGAQRLHEAIQNGVEDARFGETDLPGGNFADLGSRTVSEEPMLEITMSQPESLYLRGFVGSKYHADGWNKASNLSLSDGSDLFFWLHRSDFYGQTQIAKLALLLDDAPNAEDSIEITVRHVGESRRFVYLPYELLSSSLLNARTFGDVDLNARSLTGAESYVLTVLPNQVKRVNALLSMLRAAESDSPSEALGDYLRCESHFNAYVYAHFLSISAEESDLIASLLGAADFGEDAHLDYGEAKQRILDFLNENIAYRETTPPRLDGGDFLNEFLNVNRSGYDVHYATAAAMMLRYFGIPARYVEGYLITPSDAESMQPGEPFLLRGERAHAWCEYYQDGVGWIPFEVAPPYLNLMERSDLSPSAASPQDSTAPEKSPDAAQENSLDMEEDFHDDFEDEEAPDDTPLPLGWIKPFAWAIAALLLILLFLLWFGARIADLRRRHSFRLKDRRKAVANLYAYLFVLMKEIYRWPDCVAPSGFCATVRADQGEDAAIKYEKMIKIGEAAAFDTREIAPDDFQFAYRYVCKSRKLLKKRSSLPRRLTLRYLRRLL